MLLYAITDRHQLPGTDKLTAVERFVEAAARADVNYIQLREKDLIPRELERLAVRCMERVRRARAESASRTLLLVNSRADVAIACGADGVHLRSASSGEISAADARAIFASGGISAATIGVSCHTDREVLQAESEGADFAVFGPVFGKGRGKDASPGIALQALGQICSRHPNLMPVLALGGVNLTNAQRCTEAGAAGVAGIRLFQEGDLQGTVRALR